MGDDVDLLWTLISGVLCLLMAAGVAAVIEGFSRRRTVSTGAGRHLATAAGAIGGSIGADALLQLTSMGSLVPDRFHLWAHVAAAVLMAMIVSGAVVERATFVAHGLIGVVAGGVVAPGLIWGQQDGGILQSITIQGESFVDASAATLFSVAGWMAVVGTMVIGPRRGRLGPDGRSRVVPGKSMPAASLGTLVVIATSIGLAGRPTNLWNDQLPSAANMIVLSAAAGAVVALAVGWRELGASSTASLVHGSLAGVVASLGAPLELSAVRAVLVGAIGALLAMLTIRLVDRAKVDDPAGMIGIFCAAGVWGTFASATTAGGFAAQLVGSLIIAAWTVVVAGVLFGLLRLARLLRVSPEVEVVGLGI